MSTQLKTEIAHLLLVPRDHRDTYFAAGNKVSLDIAWAIVKRSYSIIIPAPLIFNKPVTQESIND
jgi:hypothetical protein